ncbi:MAG: MAPEG family protein [Novosphingobium sp.]
MTIVLPVTLCLAAAAALVNFWLGMRCGKQRHANGISVGDGSNEALIRAMRAQANFIEQAPITIVLVAVVELAGKGGMWLPWAAGIFIVGRICHAFGMEGNFRAGRPIGMLTAMLFQLALVVVAVLTVAGKM